LRGPVTGLACSLSKLKMGKQAGDAEASSENFCVPFFALTSVAGEVARRAGFDQRCLEGETVKTIPAFVLAAAADKNLVRTRILAIQHMQRMRGRSQSQLMRCSDQNFYVVKFSNNPQHRRVLANEMFGALLARIAGLPVPEPTVLEVTEELIHRTPELNIHLVGGATPCEAGMQFGSPYVVNPLKGQVFDYLPATMLERVQNVATFAGMLVLDKWTGNCDSRQAAFWRLISQCNYAVAFIDQEQCFNGGNWNFPDTALGGVYSQNVVYENILGWDSFEPWLSRIEDMSQNSISGAAEKIPPDWYMEDSCALGALVRKLATRRTMIRSLLAAFRLSSRKPFPNWGEVDSKSSVVV